ncbi:hypothetical protein H6P81_008039 [Aristolochia fimbriata]|uniref:Uncharacterized protein n=1 Tax=Aristolochia fimbriata TaxID=158543 RepID=A0AAV7F1X1_ARIFI|nr:hypothetical protein H6P81_008039 [Aristolochia fimbriata]
MASKALLLSVVSLLLAVLMVSTTRVESKQCEGGDVEIFQFANGFGQGHIPEFLVQIVNSSPTGTPVSNVHVSCGEFASARLVDPHVFKRLMPNDCLVKDGKQLAANEIVSFVYTNSRAYDLVVSHINC